ncbi:MAG: hypothetical protein WD035_09140 [Balneolaceae bacterium]
MNFRKPFERARQYFSTSSGKRVLKWIQHLFLWGILFWLIYQLSLIGWLNVWKSLPKQFWFYFLFIIMYFQLPLFEVLIYRITWTFEALRSIPIFLIKRVYNKDVIGYSGEVYFYVWARSHLSLKDRDIFMTIKDNNIISSIASTIVAVGLLSLFFFTDQIVFIEWVIDHNRAYFFGGTLLVLTLLILFVSFRRFVITMTLDKAYKIFGIQMFRLIFLQCVNVLMYYVVLPDTPLYVWFSLISVEIILSRIPFLPNRDLIFVGMSIGLAEGLMVSQTDIAGIMVARAALGKLFNFLSFGLANLAKKSTIVPEIDEDEIR